MKHPANRAVRIAVLILLAGVVSGWLGCSTAGIQKLSANEEWHIQEGQAAWRGGYDRPELAGDLLLATRGREAAIVNFSKTPLPFVEAQVTATNWHIEFPARKLKFGGRGKPPKRLGWLYLPAALAGEPLPGGFRFERQPAGGWRLENTRSGETIEGYLAP